MSRMMKQMLGALAIPLVFGVGSALAGPNDCGECESCQRFHCPPGLKHCMERPPHIHFECGCPRPICNPCLNQNWGYFEPCWNPWPWPADFSHCRVTPPAATVVLDPGAAANVYSTPYPTPPQRLPLAPQTAPGPDSGGPVLPAPRQVRPGL